LRRYAILGGAVLMQTCLGATYSWSVYVRPLKQLTGLLQGPVQLPFSVFYFVFPATMVLAGTLLPRLGPRRCAVAGGMLFGAGWVVAGLGSHHFALTVLGIGGLAGVGAGLAYIVPIATCIQWFPRQKGLVTGLAVAGFGGGAALVSQVGGHLMGSAGATPFDVFRFLGVVFALVVGGAGMVMANHPDARARERAQLPVGQVLARSEFRVLYLAMFCGLAAGFAVNANLKELSLGGRVEIGITAVSLFALGNAAGRVGWGLIFDRVRSVTAIRGNLLSQAVLLLAAPALVETEVGFLAFSTLAGWNYGGVLVLYASSTARIWGSERVGQVYGWLFSANIPAAFAPMIAGFGYDRLGSFTVPLLVLAALLIGAASVVGHFRGVLATAEP
jgi:OFA family oxalate/formate antiporter-like MFS transporter